MTWQIYAIANPAEPWRWAGSGDTPEEAWLDAAREGWGGRADLGRMGFDLFLVTGERVLEPLPEPGDQP